MPTIPKPRWSNLLTRSFAKLSQSARLIFTSNRWKTICAFGSRATASSGRSNEFAREQCGDRRARVDDSNRQRRVNQPAFAKPRRTALQFRATRFGRYEGENYSESPRPTERNYPAHGSYRLREINLAVLFSQQHQFRAAPDHYN